MPGSQGSDSSLSPKPCKLVPNTLMVSSRGRRTKGGNLELTEFKLENDRESRKTKAVFPATRQFKLTLNYRKMRRPLGAPLRSWPESSMPGARGEHTAPQTSGGSPVPRRPSVFLHPLFYSPSRLALLLHPPTWVTAPVPVRHAVSLVPATRETDLGLRPDLTWSERKNKLYLGRHCCPRHPRPRS